MSQTVHDGERKDLRCWFDGIGTEIFEGFKSIFDDREFDINY